MTVQAGRQSVDEIERELTGAEWHLVDVREQLKRLPMSRGRTKLEKITHKALIGAEKLLSAQIGELSKLRYETAEAEAAKARHEARDLQDLVQKVRHKAVDESDGYVVAYYSAARSLGLSETDSRVIKEHLLSVVKPKREAR